VSARCECADPKCPHCWGACKDRPVVTLGRVDSDGHVRMCEACGQDALESGVFFVSHAWKRKAVAS
jgi:hypothetical protein